MSPVAGEVRDALQKVTFEAGAMPVAANSTGQFHLKGKYVDELTRQIVQTVLWRQSIEYAQNFYAPQFIELGGRQILRPMIENILGNSTMKT
ncbi:hypothetical protein [Streptomyces sp. NPDC048419]|uniref:hypothetical protein n=1 Tax=Streptomyces sp. NPDC048419 TaxID=3365547 RepID=UPI0037182EEC